MTRIDARPDETTKSFPELEIRSTGPDDHAVLAGMNLQLIQDEGHPSNLGLKELEARFARFQNDEGYKVELFLLSGEPAGYATYRIETDDTRIAGNRVYLRQFFIARDKRRAGLGRAALDMLLRQRISRPNTVRLEVLDANPRGLAFWTSVGFQGYSRTLERHLEA